MGTLTLAHRFLSNLSTFQLHKNNLLKFFLKLKKKTKPFGFLFSPTHKPRRRQNKTKRTKIQLNQNKEQYISETQAVRDLKKQAWCQERTPVPTAGCTCTQGLHQSLVPGCLGRELPSASASPELCLSGHPLRVCGSQNHFQIYTLQGIEVELF